MEKSGRACASLNAFFRDLAWVEKKSFINMSNEYAVAGTCGWS